MPQHDGVALPLVSIETSPPHTTRVTTPISSLPSAPPPPARIGSSSVHYSSNYSCTSGTNSREVQIPKLSASTKELLARVTRHIKGQQPQKSYDQVSMSRSSFSRSQNLKYSNKVISGSMRVSSTLIELPTPPFVCSSWTATPVVTQNAVAATPPPPTPQVRHTSLVNIAPKPAGAPSSGASLVSTQAPPKTQKLPSQPQPQPQLLPGSRPLLPAPTPKPIATTPAVVIPISTVPQPVAPSAATPSAPVPPAIASTVAPAPPSTIPPAIAATTSTGVAALTSPSPAAVAALKPNKRPSNPRQRKSVTNGSKRPKKRRRGDDSDGEGIIRAGDSSTDESDVAPTATQTKSGRQVNRPSLYVPPPSVASAITSNPLGVLDKTQAKRKRIIRKGKDGNINCIYCQRGHSPASNAIVFCDGCNRAWHQRCHDPPIEKDVIAVKDKEWLCRECKPVHVSIAHPTVVRSNPSLSVRAHGPPVHIPITLPNTEVGGERFSTGERRGYLSGLSHATLVELLVALSDRQPTLPMFPENLRALRSSKFSFEPKTTPAAAINGTTAATFIPSPSISVNGTMTTNVANTTSVTEGKNVDNQNAESTRPSSTRKRRYYESSDEESEYELEDHRLYPRAGNGVQLSMDLEDLDILREDAACPTFSYALHVPPSAQA